ncbi:Nucleotide-diphospho-sugar transferase, partial [Sesbania bispinosa]
TNISNNDSAAWPVANPVVTCASVSDAGAPSNFVADPFLFIQGSGQVNLVCCSCVQGPALNNKDGDTFYLFYETKNSITMQGDIGVSKSTDKGATWQQLGIALNEDWHLSYPYVFEHNGQIYMMPEGSKRGDLRLYRAVNFPLQWRLEKVIMKKPLVDSFIINYGGKYWLFGSDHSGFGTKKNGQLEIWYSNSPLGPWKPHKKNPIYNMDQSLGARNGGRPFQYEGNLYRMGQDCGDTYGRRVRVFKIETLTTKEYKEIEVPLGFVEPNKGRNAWNGARYHHLDVQHLPSGGWVAVMDGDRVPSGDSIRRFMVGCVSVAVAAILIVLLGVLLGFVNCIVPLNWFIHNTGKRNLTLSWERPNAFTSRVRRFCSRLNRFPTFLRGVGLMCIGAKNIYGGNGSEEPYPYKGQYSQFTLLTMTYDARLWNLKMYVKHYSRCSSVAEIVVVWNKGVPPKLSDLDSAVPHPDRIVGFYPRLIDGSPLKYRGEKYARTHKGYNMILTGAAFIDSQVAFKRYWGEEAKKGREMVDKFFNCEDVLLNYLYANASSSRRTVDYVKPAWAIDTSKLSGAAISRNTKVHYGLRSHCLMKFSEMYGSLAGRKWGFDSRKDGWDV